MMQKNSNHKFISLTVVINLLPFQTVLYCSGIGISSCAYERNDSEEEFAKNKKIINNKQVTHEFAVISRYKHIHLRRLCRNNLCLGGFSAQVNLSK